MAAFIKDVKIADIIIFRFIDAITVNKENIGYRKSGIGYQKIPKDKR